MESKHLPGSVSHPGARAVTQYSTNRGGQGGQRPAHEPELGADPDHSTWRRGPACGAFDGHAGGNMPETLWRRHCSLISFWCSSFSTCLGGHVDVSSHVGLSDVPSWMQTANTAIVGVFLLELLLKFIALGCTEFWCAKDSSWNLFDFVIIAISVADVALDILATSLTPDVNTGHLRLIRSIRLARALRSMRSWQYIGGLRTLALSIVSTLGSLFWTLMLLLIIFYSFGVVLTQMVVEHCRYMNIEVTGDNNAIPVCPDDLKKYWSSVPTSMLTLFMSITGGLDWEAPVRPLWGVSRLAVVLVLIFVAITVFAILNAPVMYGNTAIESAASDKEVASMRQVQSKAKQVDTLRGIFQELDRGKTNELSIEDIHQGIEEGELSNFLESIGISTGDVWTLFMLLDSDQQGCIDLEEFVNGCMQLHGPAKSMQMAKMSFENKITRQSIKQLSKEVRTLRQCLTALLSPSKELF
ncbi:L type [Durusdinium trenchii]|uniref:L type n=1 Tax=Durusdinium trenchii TaxID=1381693 RepID=A0ABP0IQK9_9DINO